jgi:hypothetical protein
VDTKAFFDLLSTVSSIPQIAAKRKSRHIRRRVRSHHLLIMAVKSSLCRIRNESTHYRSECFAKFPGVTMVI